MHNSCLYRESRLCVFPKVRPKKSSKLKKPAPFDSVFCSYSIQLARYCGKILHNTFRFFSVDGEPRGKTQASDCQSQSMPYLSFLAVVCLVRQRRDRIWMSAADTRF